jgi:hypothetical protein
MSLKKKTTIYQRLGLPAYYYDDAQHPVQQDGKQVCMNQQVFDMMKPLLMVQPYIQSFEVWEGQEVHFDIDKTRQSSQIPLPGGDIHAWPTLIHPQLACDLSVPWIHVGGKREGFADKIVINRTTRYRNHYIQYFFLKDYEDKIVFIGLEHEHKDFCEQFKLKIPLFTATNFLELAEVISSARFGIFNQSLAWHLADAQKTKRILEVCTVYPNSFATGKDGYNFTQQESLEYRFHELLKQTE